jgi:regulator of sigma E protease
VIAAGISINFIVGWLLLSAVYVFGAHQALIITDIQDESPAAQVQLQRGDELVGFTAAEDFIAFTKAQQGKQVAIRVLRSGKELTFTPALRVASLERAPLGAAVSMTGFAPLPLFSALQKGLVDSVTAVAEIFRAFGSLIGKLFSSASVPENIVGPVGILGIAGDLGKLGFVYILQLIAMISLNLAALNAIPFPALDGGRILFMIIEKLKGSPLNPVREMWTNVISFGFLILLMLIITGRDIVRLF